MMQADRGLGPHLNPSCTQSSCLYQLETIILNQVPTIEAWFRKKWAENPPPLTSSVDLRHAGFKLAPVDTNLFPAGFNNLNEASYPLCVQALQSVLVKDLPDCLNILILPENHTRNTFYLQSLNVLRNLLKKAGFIVRIGSLDPTLIAPREVILEDAILTIEPLKREGNYVGLEDFKPCFLLLNNDLSDGVPDSLKDLKQLIKPSIKLGWDSRLKSTHFAYFSLVAHEFAALLDIDPWLIEPYFSALDQVDFMNQEGIEELAVEVDKILKQVKAKYEAYEISDKPFVAVKADNGTYGMSVMMVHDASELLQLNRKQRTKMSMIKGGRKVSRVIIQEGVHSYETMADGSVAEPVVYMIGPFVVGGFYRVHQNKGTDDNLNAPGMYFEPLAFSKACNTPMSGASVLDCPNRFYVYGVIARLAALAAAKEALQGE